MKSLKGHSTRVLIAGLLTVGFVACSSDRPEKDSEVSVPSQTTPGTTPDPAQEEPPFKGKTARSIRDSTLTTMSNLKSLKIKSSESQQVQFELSVGDNGKCSGFYASPKTGKVKVLFTEDQTLLKGERDFWLYTANGDVKRAEYALAEAGNKWVEAPLDSWASLRSYCDLRELFSSLQAAEDGEASFVRVDENLVALEDELTSISALVEETPPYRMVKFTTPTLILEFSEHNKVLPIKVPNSKAILQKKLLLDNAKN